MKLKIPIIAVTLPLMAVFVVIVASIERSDQPVRRFDAQPEVSDELPSWVKEPLPGVPPVVVGFDMTAGREAESAIRYTLEQNLREDLQRRLDSQFYREPDVTLPSLPGIAGFDVSVCPRTRHCLNARLLDQPDDPGWARPMEARILAKLAERIGSGLGQVYVVCRETICGVLLPSFPGAEVVGVQKLANQLAKELDFSPFNYIAVDDPNLQAMYFTSEVPEWFRAAQN